MTILDRMKTGENLSEDEWQALRVIWEKESFVLIPGLLSLIEALTQTLICRDTDDVNCKCTSCDIREKARFILAKAKSRRS